MTPQSIQAVREILQPWITIIPILYLPFGVALAAAITWISLSVSLRPLWKYTGEAWYERARLAYPRHFAFQLSLLAILWALLAAGADSGGPAAYVPWTVLFVPTFILAVLASIYVAVKFESRVRGTHFRMRDSLNGNAVVWLMLRPHYIISIALALSLPAEFNARFIILLLAAGVLLVFSLRGGALYFLRLLGMLHPASPRLLNVVEEVSQKTGVKFHRAFIVEAPSASAWVFPMSRIVVFTDKALLILDDEKIGAVCAHEVAHIAESRTAYAARLSSLFLLIPLACWRMITANFGMEGWLVAYLIVIGCSRLFLSFARRMEARADAMGSNAEAVPGALARALEDIYRFNLIPAVIRASGQTHPALYDRMMALGVTPDFPRPEAPSRMAIFTSSFLPVVLCVPFYFLFLLAPYRIMDFSSKDLRSVLTAITAGGRRQAAVLAESYAEEDDDDRAVTLLQWVAESTEQDYGGQDLRLAHALSELGDGLRASSRFEEAEKVYWRVLRIASLPAGNPETTFLPQALYYLADFFDDQDRPGEAKLFFERALAEGEERLGKGNSWGRQWLKFLRAEVPKRLSEIERDREAIRNSSAATPMTGPLALDAQDVSSH